ncbi:MAG: trypsin-like peptidase domain-containing protein, partial [Gammaproteobacteria bacterium]|nr:trypsin-like peptidase domain-containing protein [Gammaproteobacteria bacterium]
MVQSRSESGIVRVVKPRDEDDARDQKNADHIGMGVLLTQTRFLTCAHVVNVALGRNEYEKSGPASDALVTVSFPILEDAKRMQARVLGWSPPGTAGLDCAVLELTAPAPEPVGISILSVVPGDDLLDDTMSLYGSLEQGHPGAHVTAQVQGVVGAQWSQLTVNGPRGIREGFSGSGVWARDQRATVGMAVAMQAGTGGIVGYFLSAERIAEKFGAVIPVIERRKISLRRQRSFTLVSLVLFYSLLSHFLASGGSATNGLVPWADGSKRLAAFFGVHFFAIIL